MMKAKITNINTHVSQAWDVLREVLEAKHQGLEHLSTIILLNEQMTFELAQEALRRKALS